MPAPSPQTSPPAGNRVATGISGLDDLLHGGFPAHRLYLIQGTPGTGKTTLAMQFLLEGVRLGESVLYVTLSETRDEIEAVAASHGWDLSKVHLFELVAAEEKLRTETGSTFFHPSEVELTRTTETLLAEVERVHPARVVFDSLSELRLLAESALRYRRQVLTLKQYFAGKKTTVFFLDDKSAPTGDAHVESIAHGVVTLERSAPEYGVARRQIIVEKLRGSPFREGKHDLVLRHGGMIVFPRLVAVDHETPFERACVPSGIAGLDALLGGGLDRGTSTMFMGPPGTGKSTLTLRFAVAVAERGEKSLLFLFDETPAMLLARTKSLGVDAGPHCASGLIELRPVDPAVISPGELSQSIIRAVMKDAVKLVAIDSINGYLNAMPEARMLNLQLHELLTFLSRQGTIAVLVLSQQGTPPMPWYAPAKPSRR